MDSRNGKSVIKLARLPVLRMLTFNYFSQEIGAVKVVWKNVTGKPARLSDFAVQELYPRAFLLHRLSITSQIWAQNKANSHHIWVICCCCQNIQLKKNIKIVGEVWLSTDVFKISAKNNKLTTGKCFCWWFNGTLEPQCTEGSLEMPT